MCSVYINLAHVRQAVQTNFWVFMSVPSLKSVESIESNQPSSQNDMPRIAEEAVATRETKELAERIVKFRKERGITQIDLAAALGVTQPMISRFERGDFRISSDMVFKLAKLFAVTSDELLGLKTQKDESTTVPRRWVKRLGRIDELPKRDQDALARIIDAFLERQTRKAS